MVIIPRLLVARTVSTHIQERDQTLDLLLLSRKASENFPKKFPSTAEADKTEVLAYAIEHAVDYIGKPGISLSHTRRHKVNGDEYHLGHVFTEKEAFVFGYVEPHIDTVAARIAQINAAAKEHDELTEALRTEGLINEDQSAIHKEGQIHVVSNERLEQFRVGPKVIEQNCASHPVTLFVDSPGEDGIMPVGVGFFVGKKNTIYEFMTYVPVE